MPVRHTLLALLLCASAGRAAEVTLKEGEPLKGDVVSVDAKEVVLDQDGKKVTKALEDVLKIEFREPGKPPAEAHSVIELTDGSRLVCTKYLIKGKTVEMTLAAGPELKVPLAAVAMVQNNLHLEKNRKFWASRPKGKRADALVVIRREKKGDVVVEGEIQTVGVTLGEGNKDGTAIDYAITISGKDETRTSKLAELAGLIFAQTLDPKAPAPGGKVLDTAGSVVLVSKVTFKDGACAAETPAGAKFSYPAANVTAIDFTKGRLEYLSELDPAKETYTLNGEKSDIRFVLRDTSMSKKGLPLTLGGTVYSKGLAIRPHTELEYDLRGEYGEFSAVAGFDDNVGVGGALGKAGGPTVILEIYADGKKREALTFSSSDKEKAVKPLKINVKGVVRLRIVVKSADGFDFGKHLDLADAKISK